MVSTLDTHQTFLETVGEENLDSEFVDMIRIWQWEQSLAAQPDPRPPLQSGGLPARSRRFNVIYAPRLREPRGTARATGTP